jgi:pyridinium-3,5-biscarboxylic acid mononucleotide synthase
MHTVPEVLKLLKAGRISLKEAEDLLKLDAVEVIADIARIDYNRYARRGVPEIIYARGKTRLQIAQIVARLVSRSGRSPHRLPIILSKVSEEQATVIHNILRKHRSKISFSYFRNANMIALMSRKLPIERKRNGRVALLAAGTSDMPALNESEVLLNLFGCSTIRFNDVGVAGLHRLVTPMKEISKFDPDAIIVAAGMEGALPSVIAGLSSVPVIGLPTSVGYGFGGNGESALMSMLQACSLGISVVNIDAGVAAGVVAWLIASREGRRG